MELAEDRHLITIFMEEQEIMEMTKMKKAKKLSKESKHGLNLKENNKKLKETLKV
jgi:hypothetical protein